MACYGNVVYGPTADAAVPDTTLNVVIPTTGKPELNIVPIYSMDGVTIECYQYNLTIDAVIYSATAVNPDIELEARRIELILNTPGYKLKMYPVGLGKIPVINGTLGLIGDRTPDLRGGPFPQEVHVEPIASNNAILIRWEVISYISHCDPFYGRQLVSLNSKVDFEVDEEGNLSFVTQLTYKARDPITNPETIAWLQDVIQAVAGKSFVGLTISSAMDFSPDMRTVVLTIRAVEIASENAYFPYTRNIVVTDTMSSGLREKGKGLQNWDRSISAKITLPPRVHKSWTWIIFKKILKERFRNLKQLGKSAGLIGGKAPSDQLADDAKNKNWWLLLKMKITDNVYGRTTEFQFDYLISTSLDALLSKSNIFSRVNTGYKSVNGVVTTDTGSLTISQQWEAYMDSLDISSNGQLDYTTTGPIVYSQCTIASGTELQPSPTLIKPTTLLPMETDPDATEAASGTPSTANQDIKFNEPKDIDDGVDPKYSWVDYNNKFVFLEDNDSLVVRYQQDVPKEYYQSSAGGLTRNVAGFTIGNHTTDPDEAYTKPVVLTRGIATHHVQMKGYAIRVGHQIPTPVASRLGTTALTRVGEARCYTEQISTNSKTPVYLAVWDVTYAVTGKLHSANIMQDLESNGHPGYYS